MRCCRTWQGNDHYLRPTPSLARFFAATRLARKRQQTLAAHTFHRDDQLDLLDCRAEVLLDIEVLQLDPGAALETGTVAAPGILALADELGMRPLVAHCHHGLGRLYGQTGRRAPACTALSAAIALYRAMDMTFWLPQAEATLAQMA